MAQAARRIVQIFSADKSGEQAHDPPAVVDLVYRGLRHWGLAQIRQARLAKHPPEPFLQALLAVAWASLETGLRDAHVVVDQAVAAAKSKAGVGAAAFLNALLRKTLADASASQADWDHPIARYNAPMWWIDRVKMAYSEPSSALGEQILTASTQRPPLTVRVAPSTGGVEAYLKELASCGFAAVQVGPSAVSLTPHVPVEKIPGFLEGRVSIQDASAQWAAQLVDLSDSARSEASARPEILDACAAPGGKTIGLAQLCDAHIWAVDMSALRLERLRKDLSRVASSCRGDLSLVCADMTRPEQWPPALAERQFDAILLDAPCTASGVVRRHPEIPWKRLPADIDRSAQIQAQMLDQCWKKLRPGGQLIFTTCSIFPEEGELQERSFLNRTPDAVLLPSPGRLLPVDRPENGADQDGFYYAKFKKVAPCT